MINKYYEILGVSAEDSNEAIEARYAELLNKYREERFLEGEAGNNAAKMLTEIEIAYNEIKAFRSEASFNGNTSEAFSQVESAIKSGDLTLAQTLLDNFNERDADWHYYQSVIFYKKNWVSESKKQLEIAISMNPNEQKFKTALEKLNQKVNEGAKINADWNRSGNGPESAPAYNEQQLGGDSCLSWCCDMLICNMLINCCCGCR